MSLPVALALLPSVFKDATADNLNRLAGLMTTLAYVDDKGSPQDHDQDQLLDLDHFVEVGHAVLEH